MNITRQRNDSITIRGDVNRLDKMTLKCPFKDYTALDLLKDLLIMYLWKMQAGHTYSVIEFLNLCNDAHANYYMNLFLEV